MRSLVIALVVVLVGGCGKDTAHDARKAPSKPEVTPENVGPLAPSAADGEALFQKKGCFGCHSLDGSPRIGPSMKGVAARALSGETKFADGTLAKDLIGDGKPYADVGAYLADQFLRPNQRVVAGYPPSAPAFEGVLKPNEVESLVLYMKSLE